MVIICYFQVRVEANKTKYKRNIVHKLNSIGRCGNKLNNIEASGIKRGRGLQKWNKK
jgi:hypothetical protein